MNIKDLALTAKEHNICAPGFKRILSSNNVESLLQYFLEGLDFCLNNDFPSIDYLEANGKGKMEKYGIHANEAFATKNSPINVLIGSCNCDLSATEYNVVEAFVKHSSKIRIKAGQHSFVMVDCFDTSQVEVIACDNAKVVINVYGKAKVDYKTLDNAHVKVKLKGKDKY